MDMHDIRSRKFIPNGVSLSEAVDSARGGSLGIGAHPDDLEIMAIRGIGISQGFTKRRFAGVTVTDGSTGTRKNGYENLTEEQIVETRLQEQNTAAMLGNYALQYNLGYKSVAIRDPNSETSRALVKKISAIIYKIQPYVIYTHNPFDNHLTHVAVMRSVVEAIRSIPGEERPQELYGCEVWGSLDWLPSLRKKFMDVTAFTGLQRNLIGCHESQIGKDSDENSNYNGGTIGRERSNAVYARPHVEGVMAAVLAVDLKELLDNPYMSIEDFAAKVLEEHAAESMARLNKHLHPEPP